MKIPNIFPSTFHMLIKVLFGLALLYHLVVSPVMVYFTIKANQSAGFMIAHVGLKPYDWKPINDLQIVNKAINAKGIKHESALLRLDFLQWTEWLNTSVILYHLLSFANRLIFIFILYNLLCVSAQLKEHKVFIPSNVSRIRYIGFSLLTIPVVELLSKISLKPYLSSQVKITGYQIMQTSAIWSLEYQWIFAGLLVLALAQIFNEGLQLQQEKDLTI